jgi:hypothetical protein
MKLWPSRTKAQGVEPVTDLDVMVAEPIPFRYKGVIHYLKPMQLDEFLKFTNAQFHLMEAIKKEDVKLTANDLANRYHAVIASVCDTITLDDILNMEQAQVAALYQLVIDLVTGQTTTGDGKKKRMRLPIYESVQV